MKLMTTCSPLHPNATMAYGLDRLEIIEGKGKGFCWNLTEVAKYLFAYAIM